MSQCADQHPFRWTNRKCTLLMANRMYVLPWPTDKGRANVSTKYFELYVTKNLYMFQVKLCVLFFGARVEFLALLFWFSTAILFTSWIFTTPLNKSLPKMLIWKKSIAKICCDCECSWERAHHLLSGPSLRSFSCLAMVVLYFKVEGSSKTLQEIPVIVMPPKTYGGLSGPRQKHDVLLLI